MIEILNYIDGEFHGAAGGNRLDVHNPATGEVHARLADSGAEDVAAAVTAAEAAFPSWRGRSAEARAEVLNRIAEGIEQRLESLALDETNDNGKPLTLARAVDIPRAARNLRFFAAAGVTFSSESHASSDGINYTLRSPLGAVGCISPWNLPLYLFTWKIAPALAAGNCVVAKPSEVTPLTAMRFAEICQQAGLPPGVLNVVHGSGVSAGQAVVSAPQIKAISFTGGTATGGRIAKHLAGTFKKVSLELGGKNPNIIFADCDFDKALQTSLRSSFANQGQICLCGSRILIQRSLYDRFREALVRLAKAQQIGDPLEPATQVGAIVSQAHLEKIAGCVERARDDGGVVHCGGQIVTLGGRCAGGWFYPPTVIDGLSPTCATNQEEIFGPVVTLLPFEDEAEAIALANETPYGLSATIWTRDLGKAHRVARDVESGVIWINSWLERDLRTPFGGQKASGLGREGGWEAMRFFTEPKNVYVSYENSE
ncbi:MAG: aldehyde dehydrogenase [Planctomycetota bacterium]